MSELALSAAALVTSLVFGVIAVLQTRRAQRFQEELSHIHGALDKIQIDATFFGRDDSFTLFVMAPLEQGFVFELPLFLDFTNSGDKTAREVEVVLFVPSDLAYGGAADATITVGSPKFTSLPMTKGKWRHEIRIGGESLRPKQGLRLRVPVSLVHETRFHSPVATKDGHRAILPYNATISYRLDVLFLQADQPARSWSYTIDFFNTWGSAPREILGKYYRLVEDRGSYRLKEMPRTILVAVPDSADLVKDTRLPIVRLADPENLRIYPALQWDDKLCIPSLPATVAAGEGPPGRDRTVEEQDTIN